MPPDYPASYSLELPELFARWPAPGLRRQRYNWGIGSKVVSLAFALDGMTAAAGGSNRKFVVWDLEE